MTLSWCDSVDAEPEQPVDGNSRGTDYIEALYLEHRSGLILHIQSMVREPEIAEELLHEVFIRITRMPALDTIRQIRPFLYKIASNLALDHIRARQRAPQTESDELLLEFEADEPAQLEQLVYARRVELLNKAIEELPPRAREALVLARLQEKTLKQVASELNVSQTMVEKHLRNALKKCRQFLNADQN